MIRGNASACSVALRKCRKTIEELGVLPRKLAVAAAPLLNNELQKQFASGVDPYGQAWARIAASTLRKHGPPPLTDTRAMRDGTKVEPMTGGRLGIRMTVPRPGAFHQVGFRVHGKRVPARRILPYRGMPAKWRQILNRTARELAIRAKAAVG
jgi:hypothetical protein